MSKVYTDKNNLQVLYEDNHLIIVNKRVGDIVQGDKTGDKPLAEIVKEFIKYKYNKPGNVYLGVVHRLDRPTSGIVIFAKTSKALSRLNRAFAEKEVKKTYWAIVKAKPPKQNERLVNFLRKNPKNNKSSVFNNEVAKSKKAILDYELIEELDTHYLLSVDLKTGRHHQIRAQLASIGCPIKGDLKYGFGRSNKDGGIHLHARNIELIHPVKNEKIKIEAPTPDDTLWNSIKK
ncbi:MAG: RNA pseudouridine synthase [Flavobacteriaceae bacterium]|nr:RNA pseudouridine synthase [Flavobacteriaceae bacterium]